MRVATVAAAALLLAVAVVGCTLPPVVSPPPSTAPSATSTPPTLPGTTTTASPGMVRGEGPRALPPTFVGLEVDSFPRPSTEACADNRTTVAVQHGQSIAAAVAGAHPGTTISIAAGTYVESAGESTALTWSTPNLCVVAATPGTVVVQAAPDQTYGVGVTGDDTVIAGLTLRGFGSGIGLNASSGTTQHRVTIEDVAVEAMAGVERDGIVAYGDNRSEPGAPPTVDGLLLLRDRVDGTDVGVSCNAGPCAHWWVEASTITGRAASEDSGADTFAIEEGRQIVVVDSTVRDASADGIDTKADDVVVFGSRVLDVKRNGVKLWRGGDVIDSVVDGTGADASLVGDRAGHYRYLHTLVMHHGVPGDTQYVGTWGYDDPGAPGMSLDIENCIFWQNATGGLYVPAAASVAFRSSIFADRDAKLLELSDGTVFDTNAAGLTALTASGRGDGNVVADPGFESASTNDYRTRAGSAARDTATPVVGLERDLTGAPRVIGSGPDIGPVESP